MGCRVTEEKQSASTERSDSLGCERVSECRLVSSPSVEGQSGEKDFPQFEKPGRGAKTDPRSLGTYDDRGPICEINSGASEEEVNGLERGRGESKSSTKCSSSKFPPTFEMPLDGL